jgi:IS4 transposase
VVSTANVNDITAAKAMPIVPHATYVFDLGYYDYGWWATLAVAECRIVTRLKCNTKLTVTRTLPVPADGPILSDSIGTLPARQARRRRNPLQAEVREVRVRIETGKVLRILTNDLKASAQEIADLYKRRWRHRTVLPLDQADAEDHPRVDGPYVARMEDVLDLYAEGRPHAPGGLH